LFDEIERNGVGGADAYKELWCCIPMETEQLEDLDVDVKIILGWIYMK
jgi:hypothetical protein